MSGISLLLLLILLARQYFWAYFYNFNRLSIGSSLERAPLFDCLITFYAAFSCSSSRSAKWTTFAVWMPKKMYRISVFFFLALIRRMA